jgi:hypothetical protein
VMARFRWVSILLFLLSVVVLVVLVAIDVSRRGVQSGSKFFEGRAEKRLQQSGGTSVVERTWWEY